MKPFQHEKTCEPILCEHSVSMSGFETNVLKILFKIRIERKLYTSHPDVQYLRSIQANGQNQEAITFLTVLGTV